MFTQQINLRAHTYGHITRLLEDSSSFFMAVTEANSHEETDDYLNNKLQEETDSHKTQDAHSKQ